MFRKLTVLVGVLALSTFTACSDNGGAELGQVAPEAEVSATSNPKSASALDIPPYEIKEDEVKRNLKRTVKIELSSRMNEESLKALAEKIYALSNAKVARTFMMYQIADEGDGSAWATTHYNPDLKVEIIGASADDYEKIKNSDAPEGEVLGSWMVNRGMDSKVTVYKKDGKVYMQEIYDFGTLPEDKTYDLSQVDKGIKLQNESGVGFGEYFIINEKGDLEFWSEDGNYFTAKKS